MPRTTRVKKVALASRNERLARALRENLRRRKEQVRDREPTKAEPAEKAAPGEEPPPQAAP